MSHVLLPFQTRPGAHKLSAGSGEPGDSGPSSAPAPGMIQTLAFTPRGERPWQKAVRPRPAASPDAAPRPRASASTAAGRDQSSPVWGAPDREGERAGARAPPSRRKTQGAHPACTPDSSPRGPPGPQRTPERSPLSTTSPRRLPGFPPASAACMRVKWKGRAAAGHALHTG